MLFLEAYKKLKLNELLKNATDLSVMLTEAKEGFSDAKVKKMILKYKTNDDIDTRNDIVMGYLPLVTKLVKKNYSNVKGVDWEDLQQIGVLAIVKAIENFDLENGAKFMSYLYKYIDGYMKTNQWKKDNMHFSLDAKISSAGEDSFLDKVSDDIEAGADIQAADSSNADALNKGIAKLKDKQQKIIKMYFGIGQPDKMTLQQIGDELGMSPQGVKKNVDTIIKKLKKIIKL